MQNSCFGKWPSDVFKIGRGKVWLLLRKLRQFLGLGVVHTRRCSMQWSYVMMFHACSDSCLLIMEEGAARGERITCTFISALLVISLYVILLSFFFTSAFLSFSSELFVRYKERMFIYSLAHYEHPNHHLCAPTWVLCSRTVKCHLTEPEHFSHVTLRAPLMRSTCLSWAQNRCFPWQIPLLIAENKVV